jgi:hypothetical protein
MAGNLRFINIGRGKDRPTMRLTSKSAQEKPVVRGEVRTSPDGAITQFCSAAF